MTFEKKRNRFSVNNVCMRHMKLCGYKRKKFTRKSIIIMHDNASSKFRMIASFTLTSEK